MTDVIDRVAAIRERLQQQLQATDIVIIDESHKHAGHAGARESGGGHFQVKVVSARFRNELPVARHRMVYAAVADLIPHHIHALSINALDPDEQE